MTKRREYHKTGMALYMAREWSPADVGWAEAGCGPLAEGASPMTKDVSQEGSGAVAVAAA